MIVIFGYFGIHVLEREIIFIDIALAQMAAIGSALAFFIWHVEESSWIAYTFAFGFTILASWFYALTRKRITQIPQEAIIGVSYAIAAAGALFMLGLASGGDVHTEEMLTGHILWAGWHDLTICVLIYGFIGLFHWIFRYRFKDISHNYHNQSMSDTKTELWDFLFYVSLGFVITYSVRLGGVLVVFTFLIIPATFSALFYKKWSTRLIAAWLMGIVAIIGGLIASFAGDFSFGPSIAAFLGLELLIAALIAKRWIVTKQ
ncbi:MAG: metal ABC transporter permease [Candidatus Marinimicrobia bacterium]|nr:metal ABC transporter permease [Candidatus Neomarinimicrobiota bacterium]